MGIVSIKINNIVFPKLENISYNMTNSEYLLHYIWKYRLFEQFNLCTDDGRSVEVIDPGIHNSDAGPDFFNAKVKIGDRLWAGNVEIHISSDDWYKHNHHTDKSYNSTILHVVENIKGEVINEQQQTIPQMRLKVPSSIRENANTLLKSSTNIPCKANLPTIKRQIMRSWITSLGVERLERKTNDIYDHLEKFNNSWDDVFFVLLARSYGFGLNSDEFERLALSLSYKVVQKHSDSQFQIEALFYGQAGMLSSDEIVDDYYINLKREYKFLAHKYQLKPLSGFLFKRMRVRPSAFPQVRIAQLSSLLVQSGRLFSTIVEVEDYKRLRLHFQSDVSEYWKTHYSFGKESKRSDKRLSEASLNVIIINTVVPMLFAYGKMRGDERYCDRAMSILESIKPERNSIVKEFEASGVEVNSAFDSQAIIQLRKEYCNKRKCLYCNIGYRILSK